MASFKKYFLFVLLILGTSLILQSSARAADFMDDDWPVSDEEEDKSSEASQPESAQRSLSAGADTHASHDGHVAASSDSEGKSGFSGASVSNFNESCDAKECNPNHNLRCEASTKKCTCAPGHVYIRLQEKCYPIWKLESSLGCEFHEQCENGPLGSLSRCDRVKNSCECYDTYTGGSRVVAQFNGVCYFKRSINETCELDAECQTTMKVNSHCTADTYRRCACRKGFAYDSFADECFKIADKGLASDCRSQVQCTSSPLGDLSRCNELTKKCECHDPKNPGQDNVAFYGKTGVCYEKKFMNSTCTLDDECKASVSEDAVCSQRIEEGFGGNMLLICQCPAGKKCAPVGEGGGALALKGWNSAILILGVGLLARGFRV